MFRNQYDSDNTTWSPQGRLFQLEYAMEAVKQGSCSVGLCSNNYVALITLKRTSNELGSYQQKVFCIDNHLGIAVSGLSGDARGLCRYMKTESLSYKYLFGVSIPCERIVSLVADKSQIHTQKYGSRPYGVGMLVAGFDADKNKAHLYETSPSGNYFEFVGQAIGARSQSAKTYIEKIADSLQHANLETLIKHGINALKETVQQAGSDFLSVASCSVGIVGKDTPFTILEDDALLPYVCFFLFSSSFHFHFLVRNNNNTKHSNGINSTDISTKSTKIEILFLICYEYIFYPIIKIVN